MVAPRAGGRASARPPCISIWAPARLWPRHRMPATLPRVVHHTPSIAEGPHPTMHPAFGGYRRPTPSRRGFAGVGLLDSCPSVCYVPPMKLSGRHSKVPYMAYAVDQGWNLERTGKGHVRARKPGHLVFLSGT